MKGWKACVLAEGEARGTGAMAVSGLRNIWERQQAATAIDISIVVIAGARPLDNVTSIGVCIGFGKAEYNSVTVVRPRRWWAAGKGQFSGRR